MDNLAALKKRTSTESSQALQKKIRSLTRFTSDPPSHVPATHLEEAGRALTSHKLQLRSLKTKRRNEKIARRYHMVRFFERKKAEKRLRRARERLRGWAQAGMNEGAEAENGDELREAVIRAEMDVEWVKGSIWERGSKYVALYAAERPEFGRPEQWWEIRRQVEEGKAGQDIRWPQSIRSGPLVDAGKLDPKESDAEIDQDRGIQRDVDEKPGEAVHRRKPAHRERRDASPDGKAALPSAARPRPHKVNDHTLARRGHDTGPANGGGPEDEEESDGGFFE